MSKNRKETCVFCGKNEYGVETIDQIPHEQICPQSFILNELLSYCGEKIKPHDFICTSHELNLKFKYISYKNDLPFSKQFKREKSTVYECSSCKVYCYKDQRMVIDISQLSDPFKQFILYEYSPDKSIITRSGRGIGCVIGVLWSSKKNMLIPPRLGGPYVCQILLYYVQCEKIIFRKYYFLKPKIGT